MVDRPIFSNLAEQPVDSRPRVLVLGTLGIARRIGSELESEGYRPVYPIELGVQVPQPGLASSEDLLRELLVAFQQHEQGGSSREVAVFEAYLHPGVSAWADRPELTRVGEEFGLHVIAPPPRVISLFANKLNLLSEADRIGIPHLVIGFEPILSLRETQALIERERDGSDLETPIVLKALRGCADGNGVKVISGTEGLERSLPLWLDQLRLNFGEAAFFAERYLEGARHVVFPFCRFADGRVEFFPSVDASLKARQRKYLEFCPCEEISPVTEAAIRETCLRFLDHCGFVGVGSMEFLTEGERYYLIDAVPRLSTGFHLWETVAGTRAVSWQLASLLGPDGAFTGRAPGKHHWRAGVGMHIYAENPILQLPQPGVVREAPEKLSWEDGSSSVALDLSVDAGDEVLTQSNGFVGAAWVFADSRAKAHEAAVKALQQIWFAGSLQTNERFLGELLSHPWVREGIYHASFVDEEFIPRVDPPPALLKTAVALCASLGSERWSLEREGDSNVFLLENYRKPAAPDGVVERWTVGDRTANAEGVVVRWFGEPQRWSDRGRPGVSGRVVIPRESGSDVDSEHPGVMRVCVFPAGPATWQVRIGKWVLPVRRKELPVRTDKRIFKLSALVAGRVHSILFRNGAEVAAHEPLMVVESLQTLVPHAIPLDARVILWKVRAEDEVFLGQDLAEIELMGDRN